MSDKQDKQEKAELELLLRQPPFVNFLYRTSIQMAGLLEYNRPAANGSDGRNLASEGRRNLGLDILHDAARGIPLDDPDARLTVLLDQILRERIQSTPQEKPSAEPSDRYDDDPEE